MRYSISEGLTAAADVAGPVDRSSVILLHGGGQTRHSWGGAMKALVAAGYHVINLDARGHGDSDWSPIGDYSLDALSADLAAVCATLPTPPALVGASMGGATALNAIGAHRLQAGALVLVDIVPRIEAEGGAKIIAFMRAHTDGFDSVEAAADAVTAFYPQRPRPANPAGLMKNLRRRADGRLYWHWDPRVVELRNPAEPPRFTEQLLAACEGVTVPSLLVRGLSSDIVSEAGIDELRTRLPQLQVLNVSGAGHMVAGDKNDAFNQGVIEFLLQHLPP